MLDLAGADAESQRADAAMTGGVAVAADNGCAGQRKALFGADDMDNALLAVGRADIFDAEGGGVGLKRGQLLRAFDIGNRDAVARRILARGGRQIMVGHRQRQVRTANGAARSAQSFKRLRAGDFVHQMAVDKDQAGAIVAPVNDMGVPDFFVQSARAWVMMRRLRHSYAGFASRRGRFLRLFWKS